MHRMAHCQHAIEYSLSILASKWTISLVRQMFAGVQRTSALKRSLPGISYKVLAERLRELEACGLVRRSVQPSIPLHVEYSLTAKGEQLFEVIRNLKELGEKWWRSTDHASSDDAACSVTFCTACSAACSTCPVVSEGPCYLLMQAGVTCRLQSKRVPISRQEIAALNSDCEKALSRAWTQGLDA